MFARIKKSGRHQYLQIVENRREGKKIIQRVIATVGRMDCIHAKGDIETLIRSLSRFSECIFRAIPNTDSDLSRTAFRLIPNTDSDRSRTAFRAIPNKKTTNN